MCTSKPKYLHIQACATPDQYIKSEDKIKNYGEKSKLYSTNRLLRIEGMAFPFHLQNFK